MKRVLALAATAFLLAGLGGCLEVEQHPAWQQGSYAGKADQRSPALRFNGDRPAWQAAVDDRTLLQDEYGRARP